MSQVLKDGDRLVLALGDWDGQPKRRGFDFQLLSPLLLGLLVPLIAATYFDAEVLRQLRWPIWLFLVFMFCLCSGLFFYTVHFPGDIKSIVVDRDGRTVELIWSNMLSTASQIVPFQDIGTLRVRNEYDDDGYPQPVAQLVLRSRAPITLPEGTTDEHLRPLRAAIGLG